MSFECFILAKAAPIIHFFKEDEIYLQKELKYEIGEGIFQIISSLSNDFGFLQLIHTTSIVIVKLWELRDLVKGKTCLNGKQVMGP